MLISAIMPIMSIYRLPHGQYGYSGHVVNLLQDVLSFATSLLRLPSEIDVLVVRRLIEPIILLCLQSSLMINNYTLLHVMVVKIQNQ